MKIKVRPEDFIVREEASLRLSEKPQGYLVFRLSKREWDTFDLVDLLARRLKIRRQDISLGGIKDRFGSTEQLISIRERGRPARSLKVTAAGIREKNFSLSFAGYSPTPIGARDIRGNHFTIAVRDINPAELERCLARAEIVGRFGVPNYYDEQRFGSARHGKGFLGKELFLGNREKALRLYFEPSGHDDRKMRGLKSCVVENWGRWERCLDGAFGEYRRVLAYLAEHRRAFHKALSLLDRRFLVFVLNAYQSFLFNGILSGYLKALQAEHDFDLDGYKYRWGQFLFHRELPDPLFRQLQKTMLPVPGWDSKIDDGGVRAITELVLQREGIELKDLKVRQMSRIYINGIERPALLLPEGFRVSTVEDDELYQGRKKLVLEFSLRRGGYATLILKRLQALPCKSTVTE